LNRWKTRRAVFSKRRFQIGRFRFESLTRIEIRLSKRKADGINKNLYRKTERNDGRILKADKIYLIAQYGEVNKTRLIGK
jgi:hypothetical protein